jgi:GNAT superfamily N-acetyltransferase
MESARPAQADDGPACVELLTRALAEAETMRGGATLVGDATADQLWARWMSGGTAASVLVGIFDDVVVGLGAATTFARPGVAEPSGRIECCYVEEGARGVGVGSALMQSMLAWCEGMRCRDVDALALPGDRASKQRLEAAGFTARLLVLNRPMSSTDVR